MHFTKLKFLKMTHYSPENTKKSHVTALVSWFTLKRREVMTARLRYRVTHSRKKGSYVSLAASHIALGHGRGTYYTKIMSLTCSCLWSFFMDPPWPPPVLWTVFILTLRRYDVTTHNYDKPLLSKWTLFPTSGTV